MARYQLSADGAYKLKFRVWFWNKTYSGPLTIPPVVIGEDFEKNYFFYNGAVRIRVALSEGRSDVEVYALGQQVLNWENVLVEGNTDIPFFIKDPWPLKGVELSGTISFRKMVG